MKPFAAPILFFLVPAGGVLAQLMNFNVTRFVDGLKRIVYNFPE
jgi:hypothetical protein